MTKIKKVVRVEELIEIARNEVRMYRNYVNKGKEELALSQYKRVEAMRSLIAIASIKDIDNWDELYTEIDEKIFE